MTVNPTSNHHRFPTSLTNRCTVFIAQQGLYTIPAEKKKVYTFRATLGATFNDHQLFTYLSSEYLIMASLVTEFDKVCIHNSRKKQPYIYCKACLRVSHIVILHTIHTLNNYIACESRPSHFHIYTLRRDYVVLTKFVILVT